MATNWCIQKGVVCDRVAASGYCAQTACTKVFQNGATRQTNADRIRAMSDEELKKFLSFIYGSGTNDGNMRDGFIWGADWLRQPAEED